MSTITTENIKNIHKRDYAKTKEKIYEVGIKLAEKIHGHYNGESGAVSFWVKNIISNPLFASRSFIKYLEIRYLVDQLADLIFNIKIYHILIPQEEREENNFIETLGLDLEKELTKKI